MCKGSWLPEGQTEGLCREKLVFAEDRCEIAAFFETTPPSRLRRATSPYTGEAFGACVIICLYECNSLFLRKGVDIVVKAIFFDVDGTLVDPATHLMPQSTVDSLRALREKGIKLFVATGRHMSMMDEVREQFEFDGYVSVSGQFCLCGNEVVHSNPIPRAGVEEMLWAMEEYGFSGIFLGGEECWLNLYDRAAQGFLEEFQVKMPPVCPPERALEQEVYQVITLLTREREHVLLDKAKHLHTTRWHPGFLDALPPDGGKDVGIRAVLDWAGIARSEAMAFGDGENDLTMFGCVGTSVAMGNASDAVKKRADYVTGRVDEKGIRAALEQFGLL